MVDKMSFTFPYIASLFVPTRVTRNLRTNNQFPLPHRDLILLYDILDFFFFFSFFFLEFGFIVPVVRQQDISTEDILDSVRTVLKE